MAARGKIREKEYGKQKAYVALQVLLRLQLWCLCRRCPLSGLCAICSGWP